MAQLPPPSLVESAELSGFSAEHVGRTRADTWHLAGHRGEGTIIAIVVSDRRSIGRSAWDRSSWSFELPPRSQVLEFCRFQGQACDSAFEGSDNANVGREPVALAEVIHDMAPAATLAVASVATPADLGAAVAWLTDIGADVLLHAIHWPYQGGGDGAGATNAALEAAADAGVTVVQPVGNAANGAATSGGGYFRWSYADVDEDGWVEFDGSGTERLPVTQCGSFRGLRWDDFGEGVGTTDYDVQFFRPAGSTPVVSARANQQAGAPPIEFNDACRHVGPPLEMAVKLVHAGDSADGDLLEVLGERMTFARSTSQGSAGGPGVDSTHPGVVAVGALGAVTSGLIAPTSSRGPLLDGRIAPDLVAASCITTFSSSRSCLTGTDTAAGVVAGAVALRKGQQPGASPAELVEWLVDVAAIDRGPTGTDPTYGAGELLLPSMGPRPRYRPDAIIRGRPGQPAVGNNRYAASGDGQSRTQTARRNEYVSFAVTLQNDGTAPDRFAIGVSRSAHGFLIASLHGGSLMGGTSTGTYLTPLLEPGGEFRMTVRVRVPPRPTVAGIRGVVEARSRATLRHLDAVQFVVRLP